MKRKNTKSVILPFSNVSLNLAESPYHLPPDQAVILMNMDFDESRQSLVGRYGTTTLNPDGILLHGGGVGFYEFFDLYRCEDVSNGRKYVVGTYDNGATYHVAYLCTTTGQTQFLTLKLAAAAEFALTRNRCTFASAKCPTNGNIVIGFNGTDKPFWVNLTTGVVTPFNFGGVSDFRIAYVYPHPWRGHIWAAFRSAERNTIHWSSTADYTEWVTATSSGFLEAPPNRPDNPIRAMLVVNDRMIVFNLNSIGEIYYTGITDDPFKYRELKNNTGTFHFKSITPHDRGILFLDKTPPYLKLFNGSQSETLDPTGSIKEGFRRWVDVSVDELLKTRMEIRNNNLLISFKAQGVYAATGTDEKRWMAVVNLDRRDENGRAYFPFNLWKIRSNDICIGDEGTDFGQTWYSDPDTLIETVPTFTGPGLNDLTPGGTYTGNVGGAFDKRTFSVQIDGVGAPNTFKWSDDGGASWEATGVAITGAVQTLEWGVEIRFGATVGHTNGNRWDFEVHGHYVRRVMDWYDVRANPTHPEYAFGDKRGTTADPVPVEYLFRTGWLNFGTLDWKEFILFRLHGEWEGTPSAGAKFYIKYRCEGWTAFAQLSITAVALYTNPIPFTLEAQGKLIQFEFYYSDTASRPLLNHVEVEFRVKQGVIA